MVQKIATARRSAPRPRNDRSVGARDFGASDPDGNPITYFDDTLPGG